MDAEQLKQLFGVDANKLTSHALDEPDYPDTVPGRVLHIDGDFLAYQVSADDTKSLDSMMHNHDVAVETLRLLAGAEDTVSHLTASHGDKGGRYDQAIQREYQGNRKNKVKPRHLHTIKSWMHMKRNAISHANQEADDGLAQAVWNDPKNAVLTSKDKDLRMCQGLHLDWDDGRLIKVDGFGSVELDRSKSSPKVVGYGNAFFWAQMLMGDPADNIQGLPKVGGDLLNEVAPTKAITKALETLKDSKATKKAKLKAKETLDKRSPKACGPVLVADLMDRVNTDKDAFEMVKSLYAVYGEQVGFTHWNTGEDVPWQKVFVSEAKLLWMRRSSCENDVVRYLKTCQ